MLIDGENLTPSDQRLKEELESGEEGRLLVDELRAGVRITARSWVGVVRFERFEVRVVPKLAGDNIGLVEMIEFATGLDSLRRSSSARSLHAEGTGLFDLIALLLAEGTELILRGGLLADYVEREDELPVLRGRLLGDQQVLRRFGQVDRLVCRFDEHEQNIVENQLLAAALSRCSTRVTHESVRRRVRRLLAIFQEACRPDDLDLEGIRHRMTYHRLNEHYRNPHALAWLILDGLGTRDVLVTGETNCFAFLIDMNRLFEMFVFRLVDTLLAGSAMRVHYQRADRSIILNASTGQPYARVVPDILVERSTADTTPASRSTRNTSCTTSENSAARTCIRAFFMPMPTAPLAVQPSLLRFSCIRLRVGQAVRSAFGSAVRRLLLRRRFLRLACRFRTFSPS